MMKKKDKLRDLQSRRDRGLGHISGIRGVLSELFQNVLDELEVGPSKWNWLINEFAKKEVSHHDNRREIASTRGNLIKEFTRPHMTWKVFCKAMMFLQVRRFKLIVVLEHEDGRKTQHETIVEASTVFSKPQEFRLKPEPSKIFLPGVIKAKSTTEEGDKNDE